MPFINLAATVEYGSATYLKRPHTRLAQAILSLCAVLLITVARLAADDSVHFWISSSNISTAGPPTNQTQIDAIDSVSGTKRYLNIWAQPATVNPSLPFNASSNPFKQLQNFSLNLWVDNASGASFSFYQDANGNQLATPGSALVYNPAESSGGNRFEVVRDSNPNSFSNGVSVETGDGAFVVYPYRMTGLSGFTLFGGNHGMGGASCGIDPNCRTTATGPAWLVASVAAQTGDTGNANFYLQIGDRGVNQAVYNPGNNTYTVESTSQTNVVLGTNPAATVYKGYDTELPDFPGDGTPDFILRPGALHSSPVQWTTGNGNWSQLAGGSAPTGLDNVVLSGGVVSVAGSQLANLTTVNGGRLDLATGSSLASDVTVAAGGSISGAGWVDANLTVAAAGKLALTSGNPLNIYGAANIAGARLDVPSGFNPPLGQEFAALTALGGLTGTLDTSQPLGSNFSLKSVRYTAQSLMVTIALPGDFNSDGKVDSADYVAWRKTDGTLAGYTSWRSNFGRIAGGAGSEIASDTSIIPEPAAAALVVIGSVVCMWRRPRSAATNLTV